jgi:hypothetical protein
MSTEYGLILPLAVFARHPERSPTEVVILAKLESPYLRVPQVSILKPGVVALAFACPSLTTDH